MLYYEEENDKKLLWYQRSNEASEERRPTELETAASRLFHQMKDQPLSDRSERERDAKPEATAENASVKSEKPPLN